MDWIIVAQDKNSWRNFVSMAMNTLDKMRVISCPAVQLPASACEPCSLEWDNRYVAKRTNFLYLYCVISPNSPVPRSIFTNVPPHICSLCVTSVGWLIMFHTQLKETQTYVLDVFLDRITWTSDVHTLIFRHAIMTKMLRGILQSLQTNNETRHQIISYPVPSTSLPLPVYSSLIIANILCCIIWGYEIVLNKKWDGVLSGIWRGARW